MCLVDDALGHRQQLLQTKRKGRTKYYQLACSYPRQTLSAPFVQIEQVCHDHFQDGLKAKCIASSNDCKLIVPNVTITLHCVFRNINSTSTNCELQTDNFLRALPSLRVRSEFSSSLPSLPSAPFPPLPSLPSLLSEINQQT